MAKYTYVHSHGLALGKPMYSDSVYRGEHCIQIVMLHMMHAINGKLLCIILYVIIDLNLHEGSGNCLCANEIFLDSYSFLLYTPYNFSTCTVARHIPYSCYKDSFGHH